MTRRLLILAAVILSSPMACAPALTQDGGGSDLESVQSRLSSSEEKLDQLSRQVALLQAMVDRHQRSLYASQQTPLTDPADNFTQSEDIPEIAEVTLTEAQSSSPPVSDETPIPEPVSRAPEASAAFAGSAAEAYEKAMELLQAEKYETAAGRFEAFAGQFPDDGLADNALYWAGECNYTRKKFKAAIRLFKQVVKNYPSGSKVPDALLKTGYAYISLGDNDTAAAYLKQVIAKYPFSSAAGKAEERLVTLR